jgi:hypothetical protein
MNGSPGTISGGSTLSFRATSVSCGRTAQGNSGRISPGCEPPLSRKGKERLILFKATRNVHGDPVAYIVSASVDTGHGAVLDSFWINRALSASAFAIIALLGWLERQTPLWIPRFRAHGRPGRFQVHQRHPRTQRGRQGPAFHGRGAAIRPATADLIARWGGEEFVVLLPHSTPSDARGVGEKLCVRVAASKVLGHRMVTMSVGVAALLPEDSPLEHDGTSRCSPLSLPR